jgi:hypothetical protein
VNSNACWTRKRSRTRSSKRRWRWRSQKNACRTHPGGPRRVPDETDRGHTRRRPLQLDRATPGRCLADKAPIPSICARKRSFALGKTAMTVSSWGCLSRARSASAFSSSAFVVGVRIRALIAFIMFEMTTPTSMRRLRSALRSRRRSVISLVVSLM